MQNPFIDENDDQRLPADAPGDAPFIEHPSPATASYPYYQFGPGPQQPTQPPPQQHFIPAPGQFPPVTNPRTPVVASPGARGLRTGAIIALTIVLVLVFGTGLFAGWQFGRTSAGSSSGSNGSSPTSLQPGNTPVVTVPQLTSNNIETVREAVVAKVRPAVVEVDVTLRGGGAIGSGVIIDGRGYIVTNNHVVNGAQGLEVVLFDGTHLPAQVAGIDPADDLALIKVTPPKNGLSTLQIGDSSKLQVGQDVMTVGNPLGNNGTVTNGIVSALGRNISEGQGGPTLPDAIQTDAPINPGNSGGALVDLQGNLVGIPTLTAIDPEFNTPASGVGFAIPSDRVAFIAPQIIQNGHVSHTGRAVLGVEVTSVDATVAARDNLSVTHGALIASLTQGYPAASAGLQVGDVIVQIDNQPVNDTSSLGSILISKNPGDTVAVHIYRGSQQMTINVKLGELQAGG